MAIVEMGIPYSFDRENSGQQEFRYQARHLRTGFEAERSLFTANKHNALELVNHWNASISGWQYYLEW